MKKMVATGDCILIRLSTELIQLSWSDGSVALVRDSSEKEVVFIKREGKVVRSGFDLSAVLNLEVKRKLAVFVKVLKQVGVKVEPRR